MLLLRALDGIGVKINRAAAQTFERAPPAHPIHVLTVRSTDLAHGTQSCLWELEFRRFMVAQRRTSLLLHTICLPAAWEPQSTHFWSARIIV